MVVEVGCEQPAELVAWRTGMAHVAPFLAALGAPVRAALLAEAEAAVAAVGAPMRPEMAHLVARVPG